MKSKLRRPRLSFAYWILVSIHIAGILLFVLFLLLLVLAILYR